MRAWRAQALYVISATGGVINTNYATIADLALRARLPSITAGYPYAAAGGLMAYGPSNQKLHARAAYYVDRILRGAKPGRLARRTTARGPASTPRLVLWETDLSTG
jgi:putative ABC transport system substrate-binding protein